MIAQINISKIKNFKYNQEHRQSGTLNGVKWEFLEKKQISNDLYKYAFLVTVNYKKGGSFSGTKILITGNIDIRNAVEIILGDHDSTN